MTGRWTRRPILAWLVRFAVVAVPAVLAVLAVVALDRVLPDDLAAAARVLLLVAGATVTPYLVSRATVRLLPLAFLLELDLVFPDELPPRFRAALKAGSTRSLDTLDDASTATTIAQLAATIAAHDRRTRGHSERVRAYAEVIAEELGLSAEDRSRLRWAALLHDVGKLSVPQSVINKPGALDDEEWEIVRAHPERGHELIAPVVEWLGPFADTVLDHHERWDGAGYPRGLAGEDIALGARIVSVADAFEVMTSSARIYRPTVSPDAAREELALTAGSHFDPAVVRAFLAVPTADLRRIAGVGGWIAGLFTALRLAPGAPVAAPSGIDPGTPISFGPPAGAKLPDGASASGQSSVDLPDDVEVDDAAAATDR